MTIVGCNRLPLWARLKGSEVYLDKAKWGLGNVDYSGGKI